MPSQLKFMNGKEFINKILSGEKDFRDIKLETSFDLLKNERNNELINYLCTFNHKDSPLIFKGSSIIGFNSRGLYMPYMDARESCFMDSNLKFSNLIFASFSNSSLQDIDLYRSDLTEVNFSNSNLTDASLYESNVFRANFNLTNLSNSDLRNCKGLDDSLNLGKAIYRVTKVTRTEENILRRAIEKVRLFDVYD